MTDFTIAAIGRLKAGPLADLAETYHRRLVWPVQLIELEPKGTQDTKLREAAALRSRLPEGAITVALDERGKSLTSMAFAAWIAERRGEGARHIVFLIGGADGLDESLRAAAHLVLSFGALTWPHLLARIMLLEQLYRAQQIIARHPYHRE